MRMLAGTLAAGILLTVSAPASAQTQAQNAPTGYSMVTYYRCAQGDTSRADAIFKELVDPFLKSEQAAGRITAYAWIQHVEGGEWRRAMYTTGPALDKLVQSRDGLTKRTTAPENAKAFDEFGRLCGSHDDYIWRGKSSSQAPGDAGRVRAPFAMSTYYLCDSDETEADAIVASAFAPVLNGRVKDGTITSWNWMEHLFGGEYRRVLILDGKDEASLLANWATLQDDLQKAAPDLARRFDRICHGHADYIWQIGQTP